MSRRAVLPALSSPSRALAWGLGLCALLSACKPQDKAAAGNDLDAVPQKSSAVVVKVTPVQSGQLSASRVASATVTAERDSRVATPAGGTVQRVLVSEGETVGGEQAVIQLDDTTQRQALETAQLQVNQAEIALRQAQSTARGSGGTLDAALRSAQAALSQAQANADSVGELARLGGVSQAEVDAAQAQLAQAQSAVAQARQNLAQNGQSAQNSVPLQQAQLQSAQAAVRQAQTNLARTVVRAPFAGTVADVLVQEGEYAAPGSAVFRLVDSGTLRVKFNVPSAEAAALSRGATFNLGYGGRNYVGRVIDSSGIAGSNRLVPVTAVIEGGAALPVGATANARYTAVLGRGTLVPSGAVTSSGGGNAVFVVRDGRAVRQDVNVIAESGGRVAVSNLEAGTEVVSPVPGGLQDGVAVTVQKAAVQNGNGQEGGSQP